MEGIEVRRKAANRSPDCCLPTGMDLFWLALFFTGVFGLSSLLFMGQAFGNCLLPACSSDSASGLYPSDVPAHLNFARSMAAGEAHVIILTGFERSLIFLSRLTKLSLEVSAVILLATCVTLISIEVFILLRVLLQDAYSIRLVLVFTAFLMLVSAIYVPFFNPLLYLGQGSPNVWHNPTLLAMKPFAFAAFACYVYALNGRKRGDTLVFYFAASGALLVTVLIKSNFALAFIPALCLYLPLRHRMDFIAYWKSFLVVLPTLLVLLFQYLTVRFLGATLQVPVSFTIDWLGVWKLYSPNIPISILLALAFPLSVAILGVREIGRNPALLLSWLLTLVGMLQFAVLAVGGSLYMNGDWSWGYLTAMQILFVFSLAEFLRWLQLVEPANAANRIKTLVVSCVFSLHLISGTLYFARMLSGGTFF
jgi:hypothetical protein